MLSTRIKQFISDCSGHYDAKEDALGEVNMVLQANNLCLDDAGVDLSDDYSGHEIIMVCDSLRHNRGFITFLWIKMFDGLYNIAVEGV